MPGRRLRVEVSAQLPKWVRGLAGVNVGGAALGEWRQVSEMFYDRTQQYVHVITADLKASGQNATFVEGRRLVAETSYGGDEVDYAAFEFGRGGEHDAMGRAWEATAGQFAEATARAVAAAIAEATR